MDAETFKKAVKLLLPLRTKRTSEYNSSLAARAGIILTKLIEMDVDEQIISTVKSMASVNKFEERSYLPDALSNTIAVINKEMKDGTYDRELSRRLFS